MGTKTIGLDDEAYERLRAEKREGESFSDVVKRVTSEVHSDWRRGFGKYGGKDGERLEQVTAESRNRRGSGLAIRRARAMDALLGEDADDSQASTGDVDEESDASTGDDAATDGDATVDADANGVGDASGSEEP